MDSEQNASETRLGRPVIDIFVGPVFSYLTTVTEDVGEYCLMKVDVPPGVTVPIHSHADRETFYILSGELEGLTGTCWRTLKAGDVLDITGGVRHAIRNVTDARMSLLLVTTMKLGQFFLDVGRPVTGAVLAPPTAADLLRFTETSLRYSYWLGNQQDNMAVGVAL